MPVEAADAPRPEFVNSRACLCASVSSCDLLFHVPESGPVNFSGEKGCRVKVWDQSGDNFFEKLDGLALPVIVAIMPRPFRPAGPATRPPSPSAWENGRRHIGIASNALAHALAMKKGRPAGDDLLQTRILA